MIPIIRVYLLVMCLSTTTWLTLQLRLYSSWLNNYPLLLTDTLSCHLLLSSGILPSMEQTIPSEISPCSKKNEQGCCISASRYHPWVTSSVDFQHCPFHLGDNSFSVSYNSWFFLPSVWLVKRPATLQMFRLHITVSTADQIHLRLGNWFPG